MSVAKHGYSATFGIKIVFFNFIKIGSFIFLLAFGPYNDNILYTDKILSLFWQDYSKRLFPIKFQHGLFCDRYIFSMHTEAYSIMWESRKRLYCSCGVRYSKTSLTLNLVTNGFTHVLKQGGVSDRSETGKHSESSRSFTHSAVAALRDLWDDI